MKMTFQEFADINPKVTLNKNTAYSFIPMENIISGNKFSSPKTSKLFTGGGAKFTNGDIVFARITPCLENGKIAIVKNLTDGKGFGSTEFFVFRGKEGVSDSDYIYYLCLTDTFKKTAEKSMTGASGRQRADLNSVRFIEMDFPALSIQTKIASILSAYDDLIENNTHRIQILEQLALTIYKEWFVNFRFPGYENTKFVDSHLGNLSNGQIRIPEGWELKEVNNLVNRFKSGKTFTEKEIDDSGNVIVVDQSTNEFLGYHNEGPAHIADYENPMIIFGDHTCKMQLMVQPFSLGPNVIPLKAMDQIDIYYLYYLINSLVETKEYKRHWNDLVSKKVLSASSQLQKDYGVYIKEFYKEMILLKNINQNLRRTRDLLLPKLMSGEVEVQ